MRHDLGEEGPGALPPAHGDELREQFGVMCRPLGGGDAQIGSLVDQLPTMGHDGATFWPQDLHLDEAGEDGRRDLLVERPTLERPGQGREVLVVVPPHQVALRAEVAEQGGTADPAASAIWAMEVSA